MTARCAPVLAFMILAAAPIPPPVLAGTLAGAAHAASPLDGFDTELALSADAVLVPGAPETPRAGPLGEVRIELTSQRVLENTHRIGFAGGIVVRRDSGRTGLSQSVGICPAGMADCASAGGAAPVGAFTGFAAAPGLEGRDPAMAIETAYLFWRGGYAELRAGYGHGAAQLESEPMPGAFWLMRADGARTDPSGRNLASTANTLSGHAPKITVRSVRLAGFRAAASFTPDGDVCGAGWCRPAREPGVLAAASVRDIAELGLSFDHRFAATGVRWTAGLGLARGRAAGPDRAHFENPWAASARLVRSQGPWSAGVSALVSNDGVSGARYRAEAASLSYEHGDWLFSVEASQARSSLVHASSETVQAGASRYFEPGFIIGLGISHTQGGRAAVSGPLRTRQSDSGTRLFLEAGLRF